MALYTKHRPNSFETMIGHEVVLTSVKQNLANPEHNHAWLFTGQSGIGKTTIARILAKEFGATPSGILEQDVGSDGGVSLARALKQYTRHKSPGSPVTVIILDECHQLTISAQNALLKELEDTPKHVYYILCTTDPEKILETIRQRCLQFRFNGLTADESELLLWTVAEKESIKLTDEIAKAIIERSNGSPRLTLNMLEKVAPVAPDLKQSLELLNGTTREMNTDSSEGIGFEIIDLMFTKQKCQWKDLVKLLNTKVLGKKDNIKNVKASLIYAFGKKLMLTPYAWLAESAIKLETTLNTINSEGAFLGLMFEIWRDCPIQEVHSESDGNSTQQATKKLPLLRNRPTSNIL